MTDIVENIVSTVVDTELTEKRGPGRPKTKVTLKRVVLLDGTPVGRGRPKGDSKGERTVVFIPVDEEYDVNVHGKGKKYIPNLNQYKIPIKRMDISKYQKLVSKMVSLDKTVEA